MSISDKNILSYTSQDYESILKEIMATKKELMPEYTDDTDTDFGNLILTYCAMLFDILSNKLDYSVNEAIPMLSETIKAMYKHCKWIGYKPKSNQASSTMFEITIINNGESQYITKGSKVTMPYMVNNSYVIFEIADDVDCSAPEGVGLEEQYTIQCIGVQGESVQEELGTSDGKADQNFVITYYPYVEGSIEVEVKHIDGRSEFYYVNDNNSFVNTNENDRVIVLEQVDSTLVKIKFGDGYNGKIPEVGSSIIAHYRIGGGLIGNRPAYSINVPMFDMPSNFISITNIVEAKGGTDAENVDSIKKTIEKGQHKIIYSLMRLQDFNNFLSKPNRQEYIEKFMVCKDAVDPIRKFRPIAIYIKPVGSGFELDDSHKQELLSEMEEYKLIDDEYNIYGVQPMYIKIRLKCKSDGLTIESQLGNAIVYAIVSHIESLDIGNDDITLTDFVGLYADDIRNVVRGIEGVRRFISMDFLDLKYNDVAPYSKAEISDDVYDIILNKGQLFAIENIETDIEVEFV